MSIRKLSSRKIMIKIKWIHTLKANDSRYYQLNIKCISLHLPLSKKLYTHRHTATGSVRSNKKRSLIKSSHANNNNNNMKDIHLSTDYIYCLASWFPLQPTSTGSSWTIFLLLLLLLIRSRLSFPVSFFRTFRTSNDDNPF